MRLLVMIYVQSTHHEDGGVTPTQKSDFPALFQNPIHHTPAAGRAAGGQQPPPLIVKASAEARLSNVL